MRLVSRRLVQAALLFPTIIYSVEEEHFATSRYSQFRVEVPISENWRLQQRPKKN